MNKTKELAILAGAGAGLTAVAPLVDTYGSEVVTAIGVALTALWRLYTVITNR